jgi:hypothetical protein
VPTRKAKKPAKSKALRDPSPMNPDQHRDFAARSAAAFPELDHEEFARIVRAALYPCSSVPFVRPDDGDIILKIRIDAYWPAAAAVIEAYLAKRKTS